MQKLLRPAQQTRGGGWSVELAAPQRALLSPPKWARPHPTSDCSTQCHPQSMHVESRVPGPQPGGPPRPWGEEPCPGDTFITVALELGAGHLLWASLIAQLVKNLPVMQETQVRVLGGEDPLEEKMATHSSILAWKNPMDRGAWWATVHGVTRVGHKLATKRPPAALDGPQRVWVAEARGKGCPRPPLPRQVAYRIHQCELLCHKVRRERQEVGLLLPQPILCSHGQRPGGVWGCRRLEL